MNFCTLSLCAAASLKKIPAVLRLHAHACNYLDVIIYDARINASRAIACDTIKIARSLD